MKEESNTRRNKYNIDHGIFFMIEKINCHYVSISNEKKKKIEIFPTFSGPLWVHHEYRGAINRAEFQL